MVNGEYGVAAPQDGRRQPFAEFAGRAGFPFPADQHEDAQAVGARRGDYVQGQRMLAALAVDDAIAAMHGRVEIPIEPEERRGRQHRQAQQPPQEPARKPAARHGATIRWRQAFDHNLL